MNHTCDWWLETGGSPRFTNKCGKPAVYPVRCLADLGDGSAPRSTEWWLCPLHWKENEEFEARVAGYLFDDEPGGECSCVRRTLIAPNLLGPVIQ